MGLWLATKYGQDGQLSLAVFYRRSLTSGSRGNPDSRKAYQVLCCTDRPPLAVAADEEGEEPEQVE
jgi:hypothetical protein